MDSKVANVAPPPEQVSNSPNRGSHDASKSEYEDSMFEAARAIVLGKREDVFGRNFLLNTAMLGLTAVGFASLLVWRGYSRVIYSLEAFGDFHNPWFANSALAAITIVGACLLASVALGVAAVLLQFQSFLNITKEGHIRLDLDERLRAERNRVNNERQQVQGSVTSSELP